MAFQRDENWYQEAAETHGNWIEEQRPSIHAVRTKIGCSYDRARTLVRMVLGADAVPTSPKKKKAQEPVEAPDTDDDEFAKMDYAAARHHVADELTKTTRYEVKFNELTNHWIITRKGMARPLIVSDPERREMRRQYTHHGGEARSATRGEMAVHFERPAHEIDDILEAFLFRQRDPIPVPDEDILEQDFAQVKAGVLAMRKRKMAVQLQGQEWSRIKRLARVGAKFEEEQLPLVRDTAASAVEFVLSGQRVIQFPEVPLSRRVDWDDKFAAVIALFDLHFGKLAEAGYGKRAFNRDIAKQRMLIALERTAAKLPGRPEILVLPTPGDGVHCDNMQGKTSSTRNQMDLDGTPEAIWDEAMKMFLGLYVDMRSWAPRLVIPFAGGNHDWMFQIALYSALKVIFRNDPGVHFPEVNPGEPGPGPYTPWRYHKSLVMFHHGHKTHDAQGLGDITANLDPRNWADCTHRYGIVGDRHSCFEDESKSGFHFMRAPSLSGEDRWHVDNGYNAANPALRTYCFTREDALSWTITANILPEDDQ